MREVGTPALLVDMAALDANVRAMVDAVAGKPGVRLRPHSKAFKSSGMMRYLRTEHGIERVCAQTVTEAEAAVRGGCTDVLLTNQCVTAPKISRLVALARGEGDARPTIGCCVDSLDNVEDLDRAAASSGASLDVYVEVNAGQDRCGVPPASPLLVELAERVVGAERLRFRGLQCYHGGIQHVRQVSDRREAVLSMPVARARSSVDLLSSRGIDCPIVSGGGTGTYLWEMQGGVHNEIQAGSFIFMDLDYSNNSLPPQAWPFVQSLYVHATVISADESAGRRVLDAGTKAVDLVSGPPRLAVTGLSSEGFEGSQNVKYFAGGDEHGILRGVPRGVLPVGSTVRLVPGHCDPTVNMHDHFVCVRGGKAEAIWEIDARGAGY